MEIRDEYRGFEDEQEIHLRDYLEVMLKRKMIIISVFALVVLAAIIKNFIAVPMYTAFSQVLVERHEGARGLDASYYYRYEPEFLDTQSQIIRSVNVGRKVVDNLDLAGKYRHYFFKEKEEKESFLASIKKTVKEKIKGILSFFSSADKNTPNDEAVSGSPASITPMQLSDEDVIARMISGGLNVSPVPNTKILSISYTSTNPALAQMIANEVVKGYQDEMLEIKLASSNYSLQWMTDKAQGEKEKLERSELELQKYMRDNDLVTVENRLTIYPQKLQEFSSQLSRAEAERKEKEALLAQIDKVGGDFEKLEKIPVFADSSVLKDQREEVYKVRQKIKELSKKYGPKHPLMIKANDELSILQNEKNFEIQRIIDANRNSFELAASKEKNIKELLEKTKNEVLNLNEKFIQYSVLKREVDSNRLLYDTLQANIKKAGVTDQSQSVDIWVIKAADFPGFPSRPNKKRTLMIALILGFASGVGLAFLIEYLDNTIKSEVELEKRYGKTVLGSVEMVDSKEHNIESYIVRQPLSPLAESYRLIRSGLLLSSAESPPSSILVTSMGKGEGKTTTTINIARVLAQDNRKVLIIDCDLRRPRTHALFSVKNDLGLSNYLTGNIDDARILSVPGEQMALITSGPIPPNPSELLASKKMKELVAKMSSRFDFVLLDSPPVQSVTDSLALASFVDGTIVLAQYGKTTYDMLQAGMKKLNDVNANVLGFVLNSLKRSGRGHYYYGYSGYYAKDE